MYCSTTASRTNIVPASAQHVFSGFANFSQFDGHWTMGHSINELVRTFVTIRVDYYNVVLAGSSRSEMGVECCSMPCHWLAHVRPWTDAALHWHDMAKWVIVRFHGVCTTKCHSTRQTAAFQSQTLPVVSNHSG